MIPITETSTITTAPRLDRGGYIQMKDGIKCLRMADTLHFVNRQLTLTKSWIPGEWDEQLYETAKEK